MQCKHVDSFKNYHVSYNILYHNATHAPVLTKYTCVLQYLLLLCNATQ